MSGTTRSIDIITAEAAEWFTRNREGEPSRAQRDQFLAWLSASPLHIEEYLGVAESWGAMQAIEHWPDSYGDGAPTAGCEADNVVPMAPRPAISPAQAQRRRPLRALLVPLAAAAVLVLGLALAVGMFQAADTSYQTGVGEQRSVLLDDGSLMRLNAMTRVRVRLGDDVRRIELIDGEAYFRVAHDTARPFDVSTSEAVVRAVGTAFNVYRREGRLDVAVTEGRVRVTAARPAAASAIKGPVFLSAREGVRMQGGDKLTRTVATDHSPEPMWMQRRLVFDGERLDTVVAEFNHYARRRLQVEGADLAALRISGTFNADDPETLIAYLEQIQAVEVDRAEGQVLLRRSDQPSRRQ